MATLILKACGKFNEGNLRANSGYLYVSIVYNTSICLSLYCLAMFWICVNDDLKPFRYVIPMHHGLTFLTPFLALSQNSFASKASSSSPFGKPSASPSSSPQGP